MSRWAKRPPETDPLEVIAGFILWVLLPAWIRASRPREQRTIRAVTLRSHLTCDQGFPPVALFGPIVQVDGQGLPHPFLNDCANIP